MTLGLANASAQGEVKQVQATPQMRAGNAPVRGNMPPAQMRPGMEMVADTTITNHMQLSVEQAKQIEMINAKYTEQVKALVNKRATEGQRMNREQRDAMVQQLANLKKEGRQQLRKVLGDNLYIEYLEKANEQAPAMPMGGAQMRGGQRGMQAPQALQQGKAIKK